MSKYAAILALFGVMGLGNGQSDPSIAAAAALPKLPAPPSNGEMGFVVVHFEPPVHQGDDRVDCPDGLMGTLRESYLRTLPAAESERLLRKENANELDKRFKDYGFGPDNINICSNVYAFTDRPATPLMKGPIAWGFDLDGDETGSGKDPYTCKHDTFTSPAGERGIDNQFWRVYGCSQEYRSVDGSISSHRKGTDGLMMTGEWTQVILLRGVDSLTNDPDVEVVYANTDDRPVTDATGGVIHNASFTVSLNGKKADYRNILHGRIVNGVLTTDAKHFVLGQIGGGVATTFDFERGRLRLEFQPDGTVKGLAGGYMPLLNVLNAPRNGGAGSIRAAGIDCAGQYVAMRQMADGARDPKTGQCSKISYAFELLGIPAFVNDAVPAVRTAKK